MEVIKIKVKDRIEWIVEHIRGKDVLDIGCVGESYTCGHSRWLHGILRKYARFVMGIDNNFDGVMRLREKGYNCVFANAENFSLPYKFDVVVASEVIEHLCNPGLFLDCVKRHLRPNGYLILTTPNARSPSHFSL